MFRNHTTKRPAKGTTTKSKDSSTGGGSRGNGSGGVLWWIWIPIPIGIVALTVIGLVVIVIWMKKRRKQEGKAKKHTDIHNEEAETEGDSGEDDKGGTSDSEAAGAEVGKEMAIASEGVGMGAMPGNVPGGVDAEMGTSQWIGRDYQMSVNLQPTFFSDMSTAKE